MVIAMIALLRSREQRRFPALFAYVSLRLASSVVLHLLLQVHRVMAVSERTAYAWYFYTYWLSYVAGAVVVFLVIQERYRSAGPHAFPLSSQQPLCLCRVVRETSSSSPWQLR
jgi:hypothetical protein